MWILMVFESIVAEERPLSKYPMRYRFASLVKLSMALKENVIIFVD